MGQRRRPSWRRATAPASMPAARRSSSTASNAVELRGGERIGRLVGDRQMGEDAGQAHRGRLRRCGRRSAGASPAAAPTRCMPGVDLEVHADGSSGAAERRRAPRSARGVDRRRSARARHRRRQLAGGCSLSTRTGPSIRPRAARTPSRPARRTAVGAGVERRPGHVDRAVAVAVGLHDRPHRRRRDDSTQHGDVVLDRVEIDLGPRPPAPAIATVGHVQQPPSTQGSAPRRSLATKPVGRPGPLPRPCTHAAAAAAANGSIPPPASAPMMPGQHVAGAGRRQPFVAAGDDQHLAVGLGDDGGRALQQHDAPRVGGQPPGRGDRSAPGGAGQQRVLAVVRRQHGRRLAPAQQRRGAVGVPGQREQAVAVDRPTAAVASTRRRARAGRGVVVATEARARAPARGSGRDDAAPRSAHRRRATAAARLRRGVGQRRPRASRRAPCRRRRAAPPAAAARRRPVIAALPATTRTARAHLCALSRAAATTRRRRRLRRAWAVRRRRCRARCRRPRLAGQIATRREEQQPGLQRGERHRAIGRQHAARRRPVAPSTPLGMSTASTGASPTSGGRHVAVEAGAERGVDHEVGRRQPGGQSRRVERPAPRRPCGEPRRATRPSAPLLPLPTMTSPCGRTCRRASRVADAGDGRAGPLDQHLGRLRRGGIDRPHLLRRDDRQTRPSARTTRHSATT